MTRICLLHSHLSKSAPCMIILLALCWLLALTPNSFASSDIRIGSISPQYTPTAGAGVPEPVSIASYSFEVNKETGRARVVVEYTYPDKSGFGLDGGAGPQLTLAQLPGLIYDLQASSVVYVGEGRRTVCATVEQGTSLLRKKSIVKSTGACLVVSQVVNHEEDDGWRIRHSRAIDVFLQVR